MDFLKAVAGETLRVAVGLYGLCLIYFIVTFINEWMERLVRWIGNKIIGDRQANTLRK